MMRQLLLFIAIFFIGFSTTIFPALSVDSFSSINSGNLVRGNSTGAIQIQITEDGAGTEDLTQIVFTSDGNDFDSTTTTLITKVDIFYDEDGDGVIDSDEGSIVENASSAIGAASNTVTLTIDDNFDTSESRDYIVEFTVGDTAALNDSFTITFTSFEGSTSGTVNPGNTATIQVVGVDAAFTNIDDTTMYFDADVDDFLVADIDLTASASEDYVISELVIKNDEATFDFDADSDGIVDVKLYLDDDDDAFDSGDTLIAQISDNTVTFNSTTTATIDLSGIANNTIIFNNTKTYFLTYSLGASSNILVDPVNDTDDDALAFSAEITSISGTGSDSGYTYGPIDISNSNNNDFSGSVAGMIFYDVESIYPSMNVASNVTDVPIFSFKARSVGETLAITSLVISNEAETFATNGNGSNGLSKLSWYRDNDNGSYDGPDYETLVDSIDLDDDDDDDDGAANNVVAADDDDENTNDKATMKLATATALPNAEVSAGKSNAQVFYVVADFGAGMDVGDVVSLNIHEDTKVSYDLSSGGFYSNAGDDDGGGDVNDDGEYFQMSPGVSFPLTMDPTASITVIDPDMTILSDFTSNLDDTKKLIAGMYDIPIYTFTINVFKQITDLSLEFESPDGFFSNTNVGISKLSLYLDLGTANLVDSEDIFLGSTETFTDSNRKATVTGISLPAGAPQRLLVALELGQRLTTQDDALSLQLSGVSSDKVAGLTPNPYTPLTYNVNEHLMTITDISSSLSSSEISNSTSMFNVNVTVEKIVTVVDDEILIPETSTGTLIPHSATTPKFYLDGVTGSNRTYEFDVEFDLGDSSPNSDAFFDEIIDGGAITRDFVYDVSPVNVLSEGSYLIDFDLIYYVSAGDNFEDYNVRLTRSKGASISDYQSAADLASATQSDVAISATTTNQSYSWTLPSYIESISSGLNSSATSAFTNYQSVPKNSKLFISFANDGRDIDPASISVSLNGTALKTESEISNTSTATDYYSYETATGTLTVQSVGDMSGNVTISAKDTFGIDYPTASILFYTSDVVEIQKFLIYPNPYSPSITNAGLTFGFTLTQPASVVFYIYDGMGREVKRSQSQSYAMGIQSFTWDGLNPANLYIASGTYYVKMIATGNDGKDVVSTAKLAVY